jgi:hypothetical protein
MSRRLLILLTVVGVAALGASAVALAHSTSSGGDAATGSSRHHVVKAGDRGLWNAALNGVAQRLDVAPADLRAAVKAVAAEQRGQKTGLAAKKTAYVNGLATKLGKTPDAVAAAVRAELDTRLTQAVATHWITEQGKTLALGCFDDPAGCDLKALRAEVTAFGGGKTTRKHGHHPCKKHHQGDGRMTPGGRETSAPLT